MRGWGTMLAANLQWYQWHLSGEVPGGLCLSCFKRSRGRIHGSDQPSDVRHTCQPKIIYDLLGLYAIICYHMLSVTSGFWLAALPSALESQDEPLAVFHPIPARSHLALCFLSVTAAYSWLPNSTVQYKLWDHLGLLGMVIQAGDISTVSSQLIGKSNRSII